MYNYAETPVRPPTLNPWKGVRRRLADIRTNSLSRKVLTPSLHYIYPSISSLLSINREVSFAMHAPVIQRSMSRTANHVSLLASRACSVRAYATAITPAFAEDDLHADLQPPIERFPATAPPSFKPPHFRKSQLMRQYSSMLQSSPLMLFFQHNNLKSAEWNGIRRELRAALRKLDDGRRASGFDTSTEPAEGIRIQTLQTGLFEAAVRLVEFYDPERAPDALEAEAGGGQPFSQSPDPDDFQHGHLLSRRAHDAVLDKRYKHMMAPMLHGPIMAVTFPSVSPVHLKAVLSMLAPSLPAFPAPTRRGNPNFYDIPVQTGIQKLLLIGARVDGQIFDFEGVRRIGSIDGGIEGLRAQIVNLLQGVGVGLSSTIENAGRNLYMTLQSRQEMMEKEASEEQSAP